MATPRTRKPAARKPTIKVTGLNLDTLTKEGEEPELYTSVLGGRMYTFPSPDDIDWQTASVLNVNDAVRLVRALLGPEEYALFAANRMPLWKLKRLIVDVQRHYGLDPEAQGEDGALPPS